MSEPVAVVMRIVDKKCTQDRRVTEYVVEPLGELMPDEWATVQFRIPRDLYIRFVEQLRRIAAENEVEFPPKINNQGQGVTDVMETLTGLLERTPSPDLQRRW